MYVKSVPKVKVDKYGVSGIELAIICLSYSKLQLLFTTATIAGTSISIYSFRLTHIYEWFENCIVEMQFSCFVTEYSIFR